MHTYYSDGLFSPEELVNEGKKAGLEVLALTDHDSMLGCEKTEKLCFLQGIKFLRGIEISAYEKDIKVHTLGYGLDENCEEYKSFFKILYEGSLKRADDMLSKLKKEGIELELDEVLKERASDKSPVHVMHIATAGGKKTGLDRFAFFNKYLAYGKSCHSNIFRPTPEQAVEVIKESGGVSSLAHPGRIDMGKQDLLSLVKKLKERGLDGIEGVYSAHTISDTAYYKEMAKAFGLYVTGGSDAHYAGGGRKVGSPAFYMDGSLAEKLKL